MFRHTFSTTCLETHVWTHMSRNTCLETHVQKHICRNTCSKNKCFETHFFTITFSETHVQTYMFRQNSGEYLGIVENSDYSGEQLENNIYIYIYIYSRSSGGQWRIIENIWEQLRILREQWRIVIIVGKIMYIVENSKEYLEQ